MTLQNCFCSSIPRNMRSLLPNRALKNKRNRNKIELNYDDAYEVPKPKKWKEMTKKDKIDFLDNDINEYFLEEERDNLYSLIKLSKLTLFEILFSISSILLKKSLLYSFELIKLLGVILTYEKS